MAGEHEHFEVGLSVCQFRCQRLCHFTCHRPINQTIFLPLFFNPGLTLPLCLSVSICVHLSTGNSSPSFCPSVSSAPPFFLTCLSFPPLLLNTVFCTLLYLLSPQHLTSLYFSIPCIFFPFMPMFPIVLEILPLLICVFLICFPLTTTLFPVISVPSLCPKLCLPCASSFPTPPPSPHLLSLSLPRLPPLPVARSNSLS